MQQSIKYVDALEDRVPGHKYTERSGQQFWRRYFDMMRSNSQVLMHNNTVGDRQPVNELVRRASINSSLYFALPR